MGQESFADLDLGENIQLCTVCGFKCKGDVRLGKIYNSADSYFTNNLLKMLEQDLLPILVKVYTYSSVQKCGFKCKGDAGWGKYTLE